MTIKDRSFGLLLAGVGPGLAIAALVAVALWLGFLWATATPGAP